MRNHGAERFAEIGDFVEQDEEIATIETDKVQSMLADLVQRTRC